MGGGTTHDRSLFQARCVRGGIMVTINSSHRVRGEGTKTMHLVERLFREGNPGNDGDVIGIITVTVAIPIFTRLKVKNCIETRKG